MGMLESLVVFIFNYSLFSSDNSQSSDKSSKVIKTEGGIFSSNNSNAPPDGGMYKPQQLPQQLQTSMQPSQDVEYLKVVNDFLVAEVNEIKRRSQSQQATINWLLQEFSKAKEEINSLKMFQKLSISQDSMTDSTINVYDPILEEKIEPNSNLYLTNQMLKLEYPYQNRAYYDNETNYNGNLYSPSTSATTPEFHQNESIDHEMDDVSYVSMRNSENLEAFDQTQPFSAYTTNGQ